VDYAIAADRRAWPISLEELDELLQRVDRRIADLLWEQIDAGRSVLVVPDSLKPRLLARLDAGGSEQLRAIRWALQAELHDEAA
jgi:hypothetical protein